MFVRRHVKLEVRADQGRETSRQPLGAMFSRAGLQAQWRNAGEDRRALAACVAFSDQQPGVPAGFQKETLTA
jgi:hypothetical protein